MELAKAMSQTINRIQMCGGTRDDSTRRFIGVVTVFVGLVILGSVADAMAGGSKGHRIIGLIARELCCPRPARKSRQLWAPRTWRRSVCFSMRIGIGSMWRLQGRALGITITFQSAAGRGTANTVRMDGALRHKLHAIAIFLPTPRSPRLTSSSPSGFDPPDS
jgi:hypothetical protein